MTDNNNLPVERCKRVSYGAKAYESGANPDFRPSRMTQQEADMRRLLNKVSAQSEGLARRMKALEAHEQRVAQLKPASEPAKDKTEPDLAEKIAEAAEAEGVTE